MFDLTGKCAVVTGAAGGIGKEIARALVQAGASVVLADLGGAAEKAAEELSAFGVCAALDGIEVTDSAQVARLMDFAIETYGSLDILVNSAGVLRDGQIESITDEEWKLVIDVNLTGSFYCCREAVRRMEKAGGGRIINIGSAGGRQGLPLAGVHYAATKAGIMAVSRQIAMQKGDKGIRVNTVSPGTTMTAMTAKRGKEALERALRHFPAGRFGYPSDAALAVLLLASDEMDFVTGENLDINGGLYMG